MKSDIVIEEISAGKRTGTALVFFEDESTAAMAKQNLDKAKVGQRYVELYNYQD
jgi:nucleoside-triphosphatase THEP1